MMVLVIMEMVMMVLVIMEMVMMVLVIMEMVMMVLVIMEMVMMVIMEIVMMVLVIMEMVMMVLVIMEMVMMVLVIMEMVMMVLVIMEMVMMVIMEMVMMVMVLLLVLGVVAVLSVNSWPVNGWLPGFTATGRTGGRAESRAGHGARRDGLLLFTAPDDAFWVALKTARSRTQSAWLGRAGGRLCQLRLSRWGRGESGGAATLLAIRRAPVITHPGAFLLHCCLLRGRRRGNGCERSRWERGWGKWIGWIGLFREGMGGVIDRRQRCLWWEGVG